MRNAFEVISRIKHHADEPVTVQALLSELEIALANDPALALGMLADAMSGGDTYLTVEWLEKVEQIIGPALSSTELYSKRANDRLWGSVRGAVLTAVELESPVLAVHYVREMKRMIESGWENRRCFTLAASCRECQEAFPAGAMVCAICESPRKLCMNVAELGMTQCHKHGSTKGLTVHTHVRSPLYRFNGAKMRRTFDEILESPEFLSNTQDIALLMTRMSMVIERWEAAGGEDIVYTIEQIKKLHASLERAVEDLDDQRIVKIGRSLIRAVKLVDKDKEYWADIRANATLLDKLRANERQRLKDAPNTMTTEEVMAILAVLATNLTEAVEKFVSSPHERTQVRTYMTQAMVRYGEGRQVLRP